MRVELVLEEPPSAVSGGESVTLPDGRTITEPAFYGERDARTQTAGAYHRQRVPVAVAAGDGVLDGAAGQTALLWAASMMRRSGRPFAAVRLVAPPDAPGRPYVASLHADAGAVTLSEAVELELIGADPFAPFAWASLRVDARSAEAGDVACDAVGDAEHVIWLGPSPADARGAAARSHEVVVEARGWVLRIIDRPANATLVAADLPDVGLRDAAAAAVIAGAAFATGAVFREAQHVAGSGAGGPAAPEPSAACYWYSLDTGAVTTDAAEGAQWLARGSSAEHCAPWRADVGAEPRLAGPLVLVSAGGLAGNVAQILGGSWVRFDLAAVVDPDLVDVSNLNRLIGVLLGDVGSAKVGAAARALQAVADRVQAETVAYEEWAAGNRAILDDPECLAVVGVDQLLTRLEAQADWPAVLLNASTGGTTWHTSLHRRGRGACVGCLFASSRRTYAETRRPQACGAAGGPVGMQATRFAPPVPVMASYPFVSVSAAAALAARVIRCAWAGDNDAPCDAHADATEVHRVNVLTPANAMTSLLSPHEACLLLCRHPALDAFFGRGADAVAVTAAAPAGNSSTAHKVRP